MVPTVEMGWRARARGRALAAGAGQRPWEKPGDLKSGGRAGEKGAPPHAKASAVAPETREWVPTSQISSSMKLLT